MRKMTIQHRTDSTFKNIQNVGSMHVSHYEGLTEIRQICFAGGHGAHPHTPAIMGTGFFGSASAIEMVLATLKAICGNDVKTERYVLDNGETFLAVHQQHIENVYL